MNQLAPLSRTQFLSPAERLLHGRDPACAPVDDAPEAWTRLDSTVFMQTHPSWRRSGTLTVGGHSFDDREIADWSAAPHWHEGHGVTWTSAPPAEPELALCLCHGDPRVREAALGYAAGAPGVLPLVVIRCADAAEPVRERARAVLTAELAAAQDGAVRALVPLALLVSLRRHGAPGWDLVLERLGGTPDGNLLGRITELTEHADPELRFAAVRAALRYGLLPADRVEAFIAGDPEPRIRFAALRSGVLPPQRAAEFIVTGKYPEIRREAFETALRAGVLTPGRLAAIVTASRDRAVQRRCEEVAREGWDTARGPLLDTLLTHHRSPLRVRAVGALRRAGRAGELDAFLADPAARVREAARRELRAMGRDPLAHYRAACVVSPEPGAVLGLAETGDASDVALLWRLAGHPEGRIRAAALSGLRRHGAATPEQLLPYLADPHAPAAHAVRSAVVPYARTQPESWLLELFGPGGPAAVRAAGLELLELRPLLVRRRSARALTTHRDPAVRRWARQLLQQRLRWELYAGRDAALKLTDGGGTALDEVIDTEDPDAWTALDVGVRSMRPYASQGFRSRAATALCHWDGRVREAAVVAAAGIPELLPLIVLRCADWTPQVRSAARRVLSAALRDAAEETLRAVTPMVLHLREREEGRWAVALFEAALREPAHAAALAWLCLHRDPRTRRTAVRISLEASACGAPELARRAAREPDAVLRQVWTDATLAAMAAHGSDASAVDALLRARAGSVRAAGVTALRAGGRAGEAERYLTDPSGSVRACARWLLGQQGGDARARYLLLCARSPSPGAVLGLAECAYRADEPVLRGLLGHGEGPVRAAAVAGLRLLDGPGHDPAVLRPLLDDPSPAVAREVTLSLRPVAALLPADWLAARTGRDRPAHTRRAAARLLAAQGSADGLRAVTGMLDDAEPELRRTAAALLRRWEWGATVRQGDMGGAELRELLRRCSSVLDWSDLRRARELIRRAM